MELKCPCGSQEFRKSYLVMFEEYVNSKGSSLGNPANLGSTDDEDLFECALCSRAVEPNYDESESQMKLLTVFKPDEISMFYVDGRLTIPAKEIYMKQYFGLSTVLTSLSCMRLLDIATIPIYPEGLGCPRILCGVYNAAYFDEIWGLPRHQRFALFTLTEDMVDLN